MTENEKREKVIKGLEICSAGEWNSTGGRDHTDCPYYPAGYTGCTCKLLMRDALTLLKAQEQKCRKCAEATSEAIQELQTKLKAQKPRVMTLEEVQALHANDVVWLEDKGKPNIIPGIVRNRHLWPHSATMVTNFMRWDGCKVTADDDDYGKRWRCWTSKPTDEQREATPWN